MIANDSALQPDYVALSESRRSNDAQPAVVALPVQPFQGAGEGTRSPFGGTRCAGRLRPGFAQAVDEEIRHGGGRHVNQCSVFCYKATGCPFPVSGSDGHGA